MPKGNTPEGRIKAVVKKVLADSSRFGYIWNNWPVPTGYGEPMLDCIGCYYGLAFAIETKAGSGKLSARQEYTASNMRLAGMIVFEIRGDTTELEAWLSLVRCSHST